VALRFLAKFLHTRALVPLIFEPENLLRELSIKSWKYKGKGLDLGGTYLGMETVIIKTIAYPLL